ncbi:MAG TPA: sugar transferase [Blastocatellia bacterium]|jgi:lipopolysaccharide/colanic/teichoic acid biosynthesis glycosyltransferase|nr:sugar transferase [Blastocatellia bacterium]
MKQVGWRRIAKRLLDCLVALMGILILSPLAIGIALAIWLTNGRPVIFRQLRPGLNGRTFSMLKFRTMNEARDREHQLLPDGLRMTRLGGFLRSTSLDELPQLLNVLRGDLSLVGPRPLLIQYLGRYTPEQARRHDVLPGITGWAQVNGRNALSWEQKFALDVWYVDNWSLRLDFVILLRTIARVVNQQGVARDGHATMPEFMGTDRSGN